MYDFGIFDYNDGGVSVMPSKSTSRLINAKTVKTIIVKQLGSEDYQIKIRRAGKNYYRFLIANKQREKILIFAISGDGQYARLNKQDAESLKRNVSLNGKTIEIAHEPVVNASDKEIALF